MICQKRMRYVKEIYNRSQAEAVGKGFDPAMVEMARQKTWEAVTKIAAAMRVGMSEGEATQMANQTLVEMGADKKWHRSYVRIGANTQLYFGQPSQPTSLQENDLFFIDIGPVWKGYEGDCGATFQMGNDPEMSRCIQDGREVFNYLKKIWLEEKISGQTLYELARNEAEKRGWIFNLEEANGHRISEFPHALYFKGPIAQLDFSPQEYRWILEIQLRHPSRPFGSFHEDVLSPGPTVFPSLRIYPEAKPKDLVVSNREGLFSALPSSSCGG